MSLAERYDAFLFDCGGVMWRGTEPVPGASELIKHLLSLNKTVIFVSNNNIRSRADFKESVRNVLGISVTVDQLYSSGSTAAIYVKNKLKPGEKVFLIGSKYLSESMTENGVDYIGYGQDMEPSNCTDFKDFKPEPNVRFVVGAWDPYFNYSKMTKAFIYIKECGAQYIVTNLDKYYSLSESRVLPGTGAILAGLNQSLGFEPQVMGKPSPLMFDIIREVHQLQDRSKVVMVGDNLYTDIQFGINSGIDTVLVLSGVTTKDMLKKEGIPQPTMVLDSVADIMKS